jgi:hypothetical protein
MSRDDEKRIVLGSKRYASSTDKPVWIQLPLAGERRTMVEGERNVFINQATQFNDERQSSGKFRLSGKLVNLFQNQLSGSTQYAPYKNFLYYTNGISNAISNVSNPNAPWEGYPQFYEFTFFREQGIPGHVPFVAKSASSYNWMVYVSYPFSSDTTQKMSWTSEKFNITNANFSVSDGIPFVMESGTLNGKQLIYFYCGTNHNLNIGDFLEIKLPQQPLGIDGKKVFQVFSIGDGSYGSERYVFTIFNQKFNSNQIQTGTYGNFKRILTNTNSAETKSRYYIRLHKTLTETKDLDIFKSGFDRNAFRTQSKIEYSAITPNNVQRVSFKDDNQNYSFSFSKDVVIDGLLDNNGKPLTSLYLTAVQRGYMGYFNPPTLTADGTPTAIDIGWEFNFLKNSVDTWWDHSGTVNKDNIPLTSYNYNSLNFYYNELLPLGSTLKGDFCEYNDFEQQEYVLSPITHKYSFNPSLLWDSSPVTYPSGYFYKPHHEITIRVFSGDIETGKKGEVDNVPSYSWFSEIEQTFFWRDIYTYGFIDGDGRGVNYPFLNGAHYPFSNILFNQYPQKRDMFVQTNQINTIQTDDCE